MAHPVQNINHLAFRSMFEREKLSGNNFNDWFCQLKLDLRVEKKMYVIEQHLHAAPAADSIANMLAEWNAIYDAYNEVAYLILGSMTPELHRQFGHSSPYDMIKELKSMFEKQAEMERFYLIQTFHACKQEEGFVRNYSMHNMGKTIGGLHAMLIKYENGLTKKVETPQVMLIKGGKIQKSKKESLKAKGKDLHQPSLHHHLKVGIHYLKNSLIWYRMVNHQSKVVARYNLCQDKKLKMYSLGSTSGIRSSEEALNKKNHFHYTQDFPPPHKGLFPPPKSDLSSTGLEELFNEPKTEKSKDKSNDVEPESVRKGSDAPIIKDWVSNDEEEKVKRKKVKPSIKRINFVKARTYNNPREIVKNGEQPKQNTHRKKGNQRNWNNILSQRLGSNFKMINKACYLSDKVLDLENTKTAQAKDIDNLKKKVKKLERKRRFRTPEMNLFKIGTSRRRSLGEDDASKQGRNLKHRLPFKDKDQDNVD
nr:hypothetical protein [Tanacetum cinerariifolium]